MVEVWLRLSCSSGVVLLVLVLIAVGVDRRWCCCLVLLFYVGAVAARQRPIIKCGRTKMSWADCFIFNHLLKCGVSLFTRLRAGGRLKKRQGCASSGGFQGIEGFRM